MVNQHPRHLGQYMHYFPNDMHDTINPPKQIQNKDLNSRHHNSVVEYHRLEQTRAQTRLNRLQLHLVRYL